MDELFDISVILNSALPLWPGSPGLELTPLQRLDEGDAVNVSKLSMEVHTGTHVDAPWHFLEDGERVERLSLRDLVGHALVAELGRFGPIDREDLERLELPAGLERLLLKTPNSRLWAKPEFTKDYAALTPAAARWLVDRGIRLVGIDYLSIQRFGDTPETHEVLLRSGVVIVEGLDLSAVSGGEYELICLPLSLEGAEAAPARAILRRPVRCQDEVP